MRERNEIWLLSTEEGQVVIFLCCCGVISANRSSFANRRWVDKTVTDRGVGKVALIGWRLEVESREGSAKEWSLCWDVVRVVSEKARSTRTQFSIFLGNTGKEQVRCITDITVRARLWSLYKNIQRRAYTVRQNMSEGPFPATIITDARMWFTVTVGIQDIEDPSWQEQWLSVTYITILQKIVDKYSCIPLNH